MSTWTGVVTTALLGTDRRPLPADVLPADAGDTTAEDSTAVLLTLAARHRATARAGVPLPPCPAPPVAPDDGRPWAPDRAQQLLAQLVARPVPELVQAWLDAAAARGLRPAPENWTGLAALAATRADTDRALLARVLGPQGVWFVTQNPAWSRLADALVAASGTGAPAAGAAAPEPVPVPGEAEVRARPEAALDVAAPWPRPLSVAALRVLLEGRLGWRASRYGAAVGARIASADHDLLQQAAEALPDGPGPTMPGLRLAREAVDAAVAAAETRAEIGRAFDASPDEPHDPDEPDDAADPGQEPW